MAEREEIVHDVRIVPAVWVLVCSCGFKVDTFTSLEAAVDTAAWHRGERSQLGDVSGIEWEPDDG
jgi:hypothetical protein